MSALAGGPLVAQLARASVVGALFAGAVWLLCRLAPRVPASIRSLLWWAACLKLIVGLAWVAPLPLPLLPAGTEIASTGWTDLLPGEGRAAGESRRAGSATAVDSRPVPDGVPRASRTERQAGDPRWTPSPVLGNAAASTVVGSRPKPGARLPWRHGDPGVLDAGAAEGRIRGETTRTGRSSRAGQNAGGWPARVMGGVGASIEKVGRSLPLAGLLAGIWIAGALAGLAAVAFQIGRARRVLRGSTPLSSGPVAARFASLCWEIGVRRVPELRCSAEIATPQAVGLARPVVVVPAADLSRLSGCELEMALCHELVHLRRGDLWLGWIPAVAERLFFFHPFAALAAREYALAREAACDAEVLRLLGSAPRDYGRLLLRLGTTRRSASAFALGAAPAASTLKRRLEMLQLFSDQPRRRTWTWVAAVAVLVALPSFRLVALNRSEAAAPAAVTAAAPVAATAPVAVATSVIGSVPTAVPAQPAAPALSSTTPVARPAPGSPVASVLPVAAGRSASLVTVSARPVGVATVVALSSAASAAVRAEPPAPPQPPAPPEPPQPPAPVRGGGESSSWTWNSDDKSGEFEAFVLRLGNTHFMHGSSRDADRLKGMEGDLLWFRRHGKEYVIRDAATLKAAKELFRPQMELGERQAELGSRQGELGGRQAGLGSQQAELGGRQAELGARQAKASAEQARRERNDKDTGDLEEQMRELGRQQGELGRQQGELGKQQAALGRQQSELGRQQSEAARKAEAGLAKLVDNAVARGLAQEPRR